MTLDALKPWTWEIHSEDGPVVLSGTSTSRAAATTTAAVRLRRSERPAFAWVYLGDDLEKVESWLTAYYVEGRRVKWVREWHVADTTPKDA